VADREKRRQEERIAGPVLCDDRPGALTGRETKRPRDILRRIELRRSDEWKVPEGEEHRQPDGRGQHEDDEGKKPRGLQESTTGGSGKPRGPFGRRVPASAGPAFARGASAGQGRSVDQKKNRAPILAIRGFMISRTLLYVVTRASYCLPSVVPLLNRLKTSKS